MRGHFFSIETHFFLFLEISVLLIIKKTLTETRMASDRVGNLKEITNFAAL